MITVCQKCGHVNWLDGTWSKPVVPPPQNQTTHSICPPCKEAYRAQLDRLRASRPPAFNENDCGGVYDGHGVVSDAEGEL